MKKKRRFFGVMLILLAFVFSQLPVEEVLADTGSSDFVVNSNVLERYRGTESRVKIPDDVVTIGRSCFENNLRLEQVDFTNMVQTIKPYAFWGCNRLETVNLGTGMYEVSDFAFANCKGLSNIRIPAGVKSIEHGAFADCSNLEEITIPPSVTHIADDAFDGCKKLVIRCEEGSYASKYADEFYKRQQEMTEYEEVDDYDVFHDHISAVVEEEEEEEKPVVFERPGNSLGSSWVVNNRAVLFINNLDPNVYEGNSPAIGDIAGDEITEPEDFDNAGLGGIPKLCIVDRCVIADQAYYRNSLTSFTIPEEIREIGDFSFARSGLKSIVIPDSVTEIGYGAFYHCDELADIRLPQSECHIEPKAFDQTLWVRDFLERKDSTASDFLISGSVLAAYRGSKEEVVIPEGIKTIVPGVFSEHTEIKKVTFPKSLYNIGEETFLGCTSLKELQFEGAVKKIGDRAFMNTALTRVSLPSGLEELGLKAFDEECSMVYAGEEPKHTYGRTATRLSNEIYRGIEKEENAEVLVLNNEGMTATLEGAKRQYRLKIKENDTDVRERFEKAFVDHSLKTLPQEAVVFGIEFTDSSEIPLYHLGKQNLVVEKKVPDSWENVTLAVVLLDRNGQPEQVKMQKITKGDELWVKLWINKISDIAIFPVEDAESEQWLSYEVRTEQMAGLEEQPPPSSYVNTIKYIRWGISLLLLVFGFVIIRKK